MEDQIRRAWDHGVFLAPDAIFDAVDITSPLELLVYLYLVRRADKQWRSFPSASRIARDCRISLRTVWNVLSALEVKGLLAREAHTDPKGGRAANRYTVYHPDRRAHAALANGAVQEMNHPTPHPTPMHQVHGG